MQAINTSRAARAVLGVLLVFGCCFGASFRLQAQSPLPPPPLNLNAPGLSLDSVIRYLRLYADPADTAEGGGRTQLNEFARSWQGRVTHNDSPGITMFMRYADALRHAVQARLSLAICGSAGGYTGNWSSLGPDSLPSHNLGLLRDVWASPTDTNFLLATSFGGLFKSTNAGRNWLCISDNAPVSLGMISLNNIAVSPNDEDVIYCGSFTHKFQTYTLQGSWFGFGPSLIGTTDGGAHWHVEVLPFQTPPDWTDSSAFIHKVFFAPSGGRMYAFRDSAIFCKESGGSWQAILAAALAKTCHWQDLEFVPTGLRSLDSNHFFAASEYAAQIMEFSYNPATHQHTVSAVPLPYAPGTGLNTIDLSIPTGNLMYALFWRADNGVDLWRYDLAAQSWSLIKANLPINKQGTPVFNMEASKSNPAVVYFGFERAYISTDTGHNLVQIGGYYGDSYYEPTHGDIRLLHIQSDSSAANGVQDRVYYATDGGIALKPKGVNPLLNGPRTLKNINGKGLAVGRFMGVGTSEQGGLVLGSQGDNGFDAYEPRQNPKWLRVPGLDGEEAEFRRTAPVGYVGESGGGFTADLKEISSSGFSNRALDTSVWIADVTEASIHESHSGLIPMWGDPQGGMYAGFTHMWRILPNSRTFVRVSGPLTGQPGAPYDIHLPEYTKPGTQYNPPIKCMSFSHYLDSLTGYV
ncbi:MAG: hypothetical protein JST27_01425, partial [Bacteroidetes bacterium]|nr:hypothetical protein [Bacteroidota bacterium]